MTRDIRQLDIAVQGRGRELAKFWLHCALHIKMPPPIRHSAVQEKNE